MKHIVSGVVPEIWAPIPPVSASVNNMQLCSC